MFTRQRQKRWTILMIAFAAVFLAKISVAAEYPARPIEVVNPYTPGGGSDLAFRLFKDKVEKILGQPFVQLFKSGAGGAIGSAYAARSKPDGYTILIGSISALITPPLTKKGAGFKLSDFTAICNITVLPLVFCVKEDSPYKTFQDFIQAAKTRKMKIATFGPFSAPHIAMEAVFREAGLQGQAVSIPFSGAGEGMSAVLGGHVDMAIAGSFAMVGPGKLRALAIAQNKRMENYPDVPTLKELGLYYPGDMYYNLWAPKGTSKEIIKKLYEAFRKALEENREEITKNARAVDHSILFMGPEETEKAFWNVYEYQKKIIKELGGLVE